MFTSEQLIQELALIPHPEGGYFKEIHKASFQLNCDKTHGGARRVYSTIYYLLPGNDFSAWHKVASDETWYFHAGCDLVLYSIDANGHLIEQVLGTSQFCFQLTIKANTWFCAKPIDEHAYTLASCSVAPGFEYDDFTLATEEELMNLYPQHKKMIKAFIH